MWLVPGLPKRLLLSGAAAAVAGLGVSSPAYAFAHDRVVNPYLHAVLDVLTLAVVTAPLWTAYLWGGAHRGWLVGVIALVQIPVALAGFVPVLDPTLHAVALVTALVLTTTSLAIARHAGRRPASTPEPELTRSAP